MTAASGRTTDVILTSPDGRSTSRTLIGSPALLDADFSKPGGYRLELVRTTAAYDPIANATTRVELTRVVMLSVP